MTYHNANCCSRILRFRDSSDQPSFFVLVLFYASPKTRTWLPRSARTSRRMPRELSHACQTYGTHNASCWLLPNAWNTTSSSTTARMSNRRSFNARVFPIARAVAAIRAYGTCTSRDNDGWRLEWLYATIPQYVLCALHWVFPYLNCVEIPFLDMA